MTALIAFVAAFAVSYLATVLLLRVGPRAGFVDVPNERSSHETPKPRYGGAAIVAGCAASGAVLAFLSPGTRQFAPLALGAGVLFFTGLLDDRRGLPVVTRLLMQLVAAVSAVAAGVVLDHVALPVVGIIHLGWVGAPITVLVMLASINFYNFIDGIDGLAAGAGVIASLFLALISMILGHETLGLVYLVAAGASLGFLQFNFPPSRLFMGDSGSTVLGYFFAYMAVAGSRMTPELPAFIPLLILSPIYVDALLTLSRRFAQGERVFQAHRTHYYQRLLSLGMNHKQVTLLEYLFMVLLGAVAVVYFKAGGYFTAVLAVVWFGVFTAAILKIRGLERGDRLFWERRALFVIATDVVLITVAYVGAYFLRMNFQFTQAEGRAMLQALPMVLVIRTAVFYKYGLYRSVWKYTSVSDVVRVIKAVTTGSVIILTAVVLLYRFVAFPRTLFVIEYFLLTLLILGARFSLRLFHEIGKEARDGVVTRYGIIGAGDYGERLAREIKNRDGAACDIVCYIDDDPAKRGLLLHGAPVEGPVKDTPDICRRYGVTALAVGIRRASSASMTAVAQAAVTAGVPLVGRGGGFAGDREPDSIVFARLLQRLGRQGCVPPEATERLYAGRRVLLTHGGGPIGGALTAELARMGAQVTVAFETALERETLGPPDGLDSVEVRLGTVSSEAGAAELLDSVEPDIVLHSVGLSARAEGADAFLWRHLVGSSAALTRALSRRSPVRFLLVEHWDDVSGGETAANMAAMTEARTLSDPVLEQSSAAALRLPRVLTARRLGRTSRAGDESSWDITEPEAVALVVSAAAESSRGLFVPVWNGIIQAEDVRSVIDLDGAEVPPPGFERHGPVFPAEQLQASAVRGLKRVEGPLYPASDVFRKLLASAPSEADSTQREEWLRAVSAQLYHILPSGLRA